MNFRQANEPDAKRALGKAAPKWTPRHARTIAFIASISLAVSACAGGALPDDPFESGGGALGMVPINHTDRYAVNIFVDKYWAGDVDPHGGGGGINCCYPGLKNWTRPVTIRWTWGQESDRQTKVVRLKREQREVIAYFPASGPHHDPDEYKDDAYVCVILRDLDKVDLAFSPSASACADK